MPCMHLVLALSVVHTRIDVDVRCKLKLRKYMAIHILEQYDALTKKILPQYNVVGEFVGPSKSDGD